MDKLVERIARAMAVIGGVVLFALVLLTCLSVLGRGLNTFAHSNFVVGFSEDFSNALIGAGVGPINGDYELVEAGIAFAIFAFLPICQLYSAHATVDIFTSAFPPKINQAIRTFWEVVMTVLIVIITWRLFAGMQSKMSYGETTFLLQFPIWWAYAVSFAAATIASFVGIYCAISRVLELITGRHILPNTEGAI